MAASDRPVPYAVEYSGMVLRRLREMAAEAAMRGDGPAFVVALKEFDRLLRLYPQFGDPLIDLTREPGVVYNGIVPPISMRYGVYEDRRLVLVSTPPILMPVAKPETPTGE
ncbi:MAG: hypothetical protein U0736_08965 [Gemmataceae bacterium]